MPSSSHLSRIALIKARSRIQRQIEILASPIKVTDRTCISNELITRLHEILDAIEAELASAGKKKDA